MDGSIPTSQAASFAIKRRPVVTSHAKSAQQTSSPSSTSSPRSTYPAPLTVPYDIGLPSPEQPANGFHNKTESHIHDSRYTGGLPTPPPSATLTPQGTFQDNQGVNIPNVYFPPPPTAQDVNPPPALSARPSPQPSFQTTAATASAPLSIPPHSQPVNAAIPAYDPTRTARPPYPIYTPSPSQFTPSTTSPRLPTPGFAPSGTVPTANTGSVPTVPINPSASNTRRLSSWSKEAAQKYWNKETAKKAYKNSKDFLVKTNDKLTKVIDPLLPVLSVTNPEFAAAYQLGQVGLQNPAAAAAVGLTGVLAGQTSANGVSPMLGQAPAGLDNAALLNVLAQAGINGSANNTAADGNPMIAALLQSATTAPGGSGFDANAYMAALTQNNGADPNTALIASYIQQQSSASTATLLAAMANAQGGTAQNPMLDILAVAQSGQNSTADMMNAIMRQQEAAQAAAVANLAAFEPRPANVGTEVPFTGQPGSATSDTEAASGSQGQPPATDFDTQVPQDQAQPLPSASDQSSSTPQPQFTAQPQAPASDSAAPEGIAWSRQRIPLFGINEWALPSNHGLQHIGHNFLAGELASLRGNLQLGLLYNGPQVLKEMGSMQTLRSDNELTVLEPCSMANFGIPCGGVSVACALYINEAGEDGVHQAMYKVIVQSPYGHGLVLSYFVPAQYLLAAKEVARAMISSIKWLDRATICTSVPGQLVGRWKHVDETFLIDLGDECASETKELTFTAEGRYRYVRSGGEVRAQPSYSDDLDGGAAEGGLDQATGRFDVFLYEGDALHLVLSDDRSGGVEVQELSIIEGGVVMVVKGKRYHRIADM